MFQPGIVFMRNQDGKSADCLVDPCLTHPKQPGAKQVLILRRGGGHVDSVVEPIERERQKSKSAAPSDIRVWILDGRDQRLDSSADLRVGNRGDPAIQC